MRYLTFILFLLFTFSLKGQVWIGHGAEWHYNVSGLMEGGFIKINYTEDAVIDGHVCQKLVPVSYRFTSDQYHNIIFLGTATLPYQYTYSSGDTVFYYKNSSFYILYNFGAQPGDTWNLGTDTNSWLCSDSYALVDSIGTININGNIYRWLSLSYLNNSSVVLSGKAIERFGSTGGYLFPVLNNCDTTIFVDFDIISFACYQDSTFQLYNVTGKDCEYLLSIENYKGLEFSIYPNPTSGIIQVKGNVIKTIEVYDYTGNKVLERNDSGKIDLGGEPDGLYLLKIETDYGEINKKIIKINVR